MVVNPSTAQRARMKALLEYDGGSSMHSLDGKLQLDSEMVSKLNQKAAIENLPATFNPSGEVRLDPSLLARLQRRPPGVYQAGE